MKSDNGVWSLRKEIPSDTELGSRLIDPMLAEMQSRGWSLREVLRTQLAYEEAIVNAIRHGNEFRRDKRVLVELSCEDDSLMMRITDDGNGFDPTQVPDPRQDPLLETPGGRGVLLIYETMSEVLYNERGNQVTMVMKKDSFTADVD